MNQVVRAGLIALLCAAGCGKAGDKQGGAETALPTPPKAGEPSTGADPEAGKAPAAKVPDRGPERALYSLVDNRLSSHPQVAGGLYVPAGSAGFAKYMRFGRSSLNWKVREKEGDRPVSTMSGKTGRLIVPLTAEQTTGTPKLRFRVFSTAPQRLGLRINGKSKSEVTLAIDAEGWSEIEADAPADTLVEGENEILFFASKAPLAFDWMQFGGSSAPAKAPSTSAEGMTLPKDTGFAYYVQAPEGGRVVADVEGAGCQVAVRARDESGKTVEGQLAGKNAAVELADLGGKAIRLELTATACEEAKLGRAALMVAGAAKEVDRSAKPKHVILLVIDSLRADRLKPINPKARPEVPVFEDLATKAAVFTQAYVQGNESRASHASMWTSTYPVLHRMIPGGNPGKVDTKWRTIDELMKDQGTFNFGVSANGYITPSRGFGTKWDAYKNHIHDGGGLTADRLLTRVWEILSGKETQPWFGYIGFIDTHVSWRGKQPWLAKYMNASYGGRFKSEASGKDIEQVATGKLKIGDDDKEQIKALYDSNVSYQDQQLGELLKKLQELGIADDTLLIITADHGDEMFEEGRVGHGASLRESLVHVPLVFHYPKLFPGGAIPEGADTVDIVPTLADIFGAEMDEDWQGESLLPLAQGVGRGYPRMSFASKYEDTHVGRMGRWKLRSPGAGSSSFYDLESDPDEMKDVSGKHPIAERMLADAMWLMRAYNADWRKWKWGNPANVKPAFAAHWDE